MEDGLEGGIGDLGWVYIGVLLVPIAIGVGIGARRWGSKGVLKGGLIGAGVAGGLVLANKWRADAKAAAIRERLAACQNAFGGPESNWRARCSDVFVQTGRGPMEVRLPSGRPRIEPL